jgi:hypothetical protein
MSKYGLDLSACNDVINDINIYTIGVKVMFFPQYAMALVESLFTSGYTYIFYQIFVLGLILMIFKVIFLVIDWS